MAEAGAGSPPEPVPLTLSILAPLLCYAKLAPQNACPRGWHILPWSRKYSTIGRRDVAPVRG
jgi:hypothetical protein